MFKRMKDGMKKFFRDNRTLRGMLHNVSESSPVKAAIASLYVLPVRNILEPPYSNKNQRKREFLHKYTFTVSSEYYREIHGLLHVSEAEGHELVRVGRDNDGGYIMLDDLPGGIAYSFGISGDVSWDKAMASRGYDVYMYDHTIDGLPEKNPRFHYFREGIGDGSGKDDRLKTLEEYITRNGHEGQRDMILKMDVEGAEWGFLESVKPETLAQFRQITFELHGMLNGKFPFEQVLELLKKLNKTHQLIHLHPCNWGLSYFSWGNKNWFNTMEASYIRRDSYTVSDDYAENLPLSIDRPDAYEWPDIGLGHWNDSIEYGDMITSTVSIL